MPLVTFGSSDWKKNHNTVDPTQFYYVFKLGSSHVVIQFVVVKQTILWQYYYTGKSNNLSRDFQWFSSRWRDESQTSTSAERTATTHRDYARALTKRSAPKTNVSTCQHALDGAFTLVSAHLHRPAAIPCSFVETDSFIESEEFLSLSAR